MTDQPTNEVRISDIGRAAYLLTKGCRLLRADKGEKGRVQFIFGDSTQVLKYLTELTSDPPVAVQSFLGNLSTLRAIINETRGANG